MERWLDATAAVAELESVNASHPEQSVQSVAGPGGVRLVRAVLLTDPEWSDWHAVLASMPETDAQPVAEPSPPPG